MDTVMRAIIELAVFLGTIALALHAASREDRAALQGSKVQEPAP